MKKILHVLCLVMGALMMCSNGWAQGPEMNKAFEATDFQFKSWDNVTISASYFLSDAEEIRVSVTGAVYVAFQVNGTDYKEYSWNDANAAGITYVLDETSRAAALAGTLKVRTNTTDATLTITNMDAQGLEDEKNNQGGGSTGGDTGGDSGDGGNTGGGSTGNTFTGDRIGGYTMSELSGQYGGVDTEKMNLIISKKRQISNLPTVYLTVPDALNADGTAKDINTVLFKNTSTGEALYHSASIKVVDDNNQSLCFEDEKLEIKVRGNETALGTKKPYRLKFGKDKKDASGNVVETHKHDMLGLGYSKRNWTLIANQKDGSYAHNALSYHIGKAVGMDFCPGYRFVDLVINGVYRGCYMISDHVEVGSNRIELEDEDTGWYVESNRDNQVEEPYLSNTQAGGIYVSIKNPEPATDAETTALKSDVSAYFTGIKAIMDQASNRSVFCDPTNGWRKYFDEEAFVKYYVGTNLTGNHDGFMTVKMSRDMGKKIKIGPLWDHDTAFGIYDDGKTLSEDAQSGAPLFCNIAKAIAENDPVFMKKVHDLLHKVMDSGYLSNILQNVESITGSVNTSQYLEAPWGNKYQEYVTELKTYINSHTAWLVETIDEKYEALGGSSISDNVTNATIYHTNGTQSIVLASSFNASSLQANEVATAPASANLTGKNVVSIATAGNACGAFELTDGVSFAYSGEKFTAATAVYERSISSDWGTVCLPYKVVVEDNPDFDFYVFDNVSGGTMNLKAAEKTGAWKQLIYHRKNASTNKLVVRGTEVVVKPNSSYEDTNPLEGWTAVGVASATEVPNSTTTHNYYIEGGKLVKASGTFTIPAFQAYFTLDKSVVPNAYPTLTLSTGGEVEPEPINIITLVNAIEKMNQSGSTIQKSDVESIANKLIGK